MIQHWTHIIIASNRVDTIIYASFTDVFFRTDTQMIEIFNYLKEALPEYSSAADCPFVMQSSSVAPITQACIDKRTDIGLYISTCKMLMGITIPGISVVIFLRPLNKLHYILQGILSIYFTL